VSQIDGLVNALKAIQPIEVMEVAPLSAATFFSMWLSPHRHAHWRRDRKPLILCCGHRTHLTALALRKVTGGRVVVLMRPSLPLCLFDLAVVPAHDEPSGCREVLMTAGVLNPMRAEGAHQSQKGLVLIGGPSRRSGWDIDQLLAQLETITSRTPDTQWTLTTSRRTPPAMLGRLQRIHAANVQVVPHTETPAGWVARQLADVSSAWITDDSVSMVYEALTAGVGVGLLETPRHRKDRVTRGIDALIESGRVTPFANWTGEMPLRRINPPLAEADRVAAEILRRGLL
jgi:mitochondrial fission protein ELM1